MEHASQTSKANDTEIAQRHGMTEAMVSISVREPLPPSDLGKPWSRIKS